MPADQFIGGQIPNGLNEAGDGMEARFLYWFIWGFDIGVYGGP